MASLAVQAERMQRMVVRVAEPLLPLAQDREVHVGIGLTCGVLAVGEHLQRSPEEMISRVKVSGLDCGIGQEAQGSSLGFTVSQAPGGSKGCVLRAGDAVR